MNALAYSDDTRELARVLEDWEASRTGKLDAARTHIAHEAKCAPGTLENLRKGRLKRIADGLHERLQALLVRKLEAEINRLSHELALANARSSRRRMDRREIAEIAEDLARLQARVRRATSMERSVEASPLPEQGRA